MTFGHALTSPPNCLRIRLSGLDVELRALVKFFIPAPLKAKKRTNVIRCFIHVHQSHQKESQDRDRPNDFANAASRIQRDFDTKPAHW